MIWFTSDCHFNHKNILKLEPESRPFETMKEHNQAIVDNWNSVVKEEDVVYVLGDFFLGPSDINIISNIVNQLKGKIILIQGNHDTDKKIEIYKELGIEIKSFDLIYYKDYVYALCHYPMENEAYGKMLLNKMAEKIIFCYGHVHHNAVKGYYKSSYHVGVDTNNLTPVSAYQIYQEAKNHVNMQDMCGCLEATTLEDCEQKCKKYYTCDNIIIADDIIKERE